MHGDGEGHTVLRESHLGIGDLAVGSHKVAAVRQGREGHGEAACIDLGGTDGLPAAQSKLGQESSVPSCTRKSPWYASMEAMRSASSP